MHNQYISTHEVESFSPFILSEKDFNIYCSSTIHPIVSRAVQDVRTDIEKVVNVSTTVTNAVEEVVDLYVLTIDDQQVIESLNVDIAKIKGQWEHYLLQSINQGSGKWSLVIVGSDPRGAVFGLYDLASEIGVTPWYWWLDVPIKRQEKLLLKKGYSIIEGPKVKYRGIFLNDEGPSLMTWARAYFGDFNRHFYEKVFELILRLKGNYLWPAMWDSTFYEDDEANILTADRYGIVIGTSHHEPMNRPHGDWKKAKKGPWNYRTNKTYLKKFWAEGIERTQNFETIINLGMRGDGDEPLNREDTVTSNKALMEEIIADQRYLVEQIHQDNTHSPQMWALYKEVKELYDLGMDIPEDVIMLWGDDNWGNIRRLPTIKESQRIGGSGIYYHFDYVGGPRSYKWIATVQIEKIWEQMDKAYHYRADEVWIVNVGDLKPMEYLIDFFLKMAWNPEQFNPQNLNDFTLEFTRGIFKEADNLLSIEALQTYIKYNGRIKPELLNDVDLYSWEADFEAERELENFRKVVKKSEKQYLEIALEYKDTYFQLVHYPLLASYKVLKLHMLVKLYEQLAEINAQESEVIRTLIEKTFNEDRMLTYKYNEILTEGKWRHMMDQIHIGYTYWNQPETLRMPELSPRETSLKHPWFAAVKNGNETHSLTKKIIYVDIWNVNDQPKKLIIRTEHDWLNVNTQQLDLLMHARIAMTVDWNKVACHDKFETFIVISDGQHSQQIPIVIDNRSHDIKRGFIPENQIITIESASYTKLHNDADYEWTEIPNYGRTKSSMGLYPVRMEEQIEVERAPYLEYKVNLFDEMPIKVTVLTAPSLPLWDGTTLALNINFDGLSKTVLTNDLTQNGEIDSPDWEKSVIYNVHEFSADFLDANAGEHTLRISPLNSQLIIQKIVIEQGVQDKTLLGQTPANLYEELEHYKQYKPQMLLDYVLVGDRITEVSASTQYIYILNNGWFNWTHREKINFIAVECSNVVISSKQVQGEYLSNGLYQVVNPEHLNFELTLVRQKVINIDLQLAVTYENERSRQRLDVIFNNNSQITKRVTAQIQAFNEEGILTVDWSKSSYINKQDFEHISGPTHTPLSNRLTSVKLYMEEDGFSYLEEIEI